MNEWPEIDSRLYKKMLDSDIVIGTPSTYLLESIILEKKVILDFRTIGKKKSPKEVFLGSEHFLEILSCDAIVRFDNLPELSKKIKETLLRLPSCNLLRQDLLFESKTSFTENLKLVLSNLISRGDGVTHENL